MLLTSVGPWLTYVAGPTTAWVVLLATVDGAGVVVVVLTVVDGDVSAASVGCGVEEGWTVA